MACYSVKEGDKENPRDFTILEDGRKGCAAKVTGGGDMIALGWRKDGDDYILAAGKALPAGELVIQDRLSEALERLLGREKADLYAARELIVDDMPGLEICGGVEFTEGKETIFYALYLSDGSEGYLIAGFGSGEPETSFDELCGAARTFYRGEQPATFFRGKADDEMYEAIRCMAADTRPSADMNWDIVNVTFKVAEGKAAGKASIVVISKDGVASFEPEDIFGDKDISEAFSSMVAEIPNAYDISGFTITNFRDGRYGVTFYPVMEDDGEDGDSCGHDHSHDHDRGLEAYWDGEEDSPRPDGELGGDIPELEPAIMELGRVMAGAFGPGWKHGMGLITTDGEYFSLAAFSSEGGSFISPDIPESLDEPLDRMINELGDLLDEGYPGWDAFGFAFEMDSETGEPEAASVRYEVFDFDIYLDASDDEADEENDYLLPLADLFYEELNENHVCVSAVTFKIASSPDGLFVIEPASRSTPEGIGRLKSFDGLMPEIYPYIEELFSKRTDGNVVSVTLFPGGRVGFTLDYAEETQVVDRKNLPELLRESGLLKYEGHIKSLIRDEILAVAYEVDTEEALPADVSKMGGVPCLPAGEPWPLASDKMPMTFVAQINLTEASPFDRYGLLPEKGLLSFFYYGRTSECAVIYTADTESLEPASPGDGLPETEEFLPARIRLVPSISLPYAGDDGEKAAFLKTEAEREAYDVIASCVGKTKMFGYADIIRAEMEPTYPRPVRLLFQAASENLCDMRWGDAGTLYFWIYEDDLKAGRFDKCWCVMQSY